MINYFHKTLPKELSLVSFIHPCGEILLSLVEVRGQRAGSVGKHPLRAAKNVEANLAGQGL